MRQQCLRVVPSLWTTSHSTSPFRPKIPISHCPPFHPIFSSNELFMNYFYSMDEISATILVVSREVTLFEDDAPGTSEKLTGNNTHLSYQSSPRFLVTIRSTREQNQMGCSRVVGELQPRKSCVRCLRGSQGEFCPADLMADRQQCRTLTRAPDQD